MKNLTSSYLFCLVFSITTSAQVYNIPPGTVKAVMQNVSLSTPISVSNLGPVPLTIYMGATATAQPKDKTITVNVTETVVFTPSQLGGSPLTPYVDVNNHNDWGTGIVKVTLPVPDVIIKTVNFTYDKNGNRSGRFIGSEVHNPADEIIKPPGRKMTNADTLKRGVLLYPNPAADILKIKVDDVASTDMKITLFDFMGRPLFEKATITDYNEIDFTPYSAGVYTLKLEYSGKQKAFVILKEN